MELTRKRFFNFEVINVFEKVTRVILSALIVSILLAFLAGTIWSFLDLKLFFENNIQLASRTIVINVLTLLAIVEVLRTTLIYFSEGRVRVSYIVDTVLVVMLTEVMIFWFKDVDYLKITALVLVILCLALVRLLAIKHSPAKEEIK
ncbi:MAG: hypothetical protein A2043_10600 [Candidatus Schekmanbacteria bacterium GWA2_38_9]|uniref:Phosphate-starvation-inducible E-like protein n=1 Tax=Candidatus Schekmanbacteria bacterium RIFCSPLOWO2_12_FULL_38_15 TaxID=1817883 RepID=A0A1F7SH71_9BACT|nr:MAG: hypothetical protein A2043_10600 [Candidatus Schekmanbacteria bacterium GWA2_38_9]OGL48954.1 MAG: hypothetical protein A3H37_07725 [Candidatus Schekmanbacteria bacterium RIFCSPLOWO2_02_FULL_38_14]OGL53150.1 MAG: hypothetical protein A3G31_12440 [Candidatus Schekmanbacteria bacterium RIFCSPLOWO2_12_FULL_38_15]